MDDSRRLWNGRWDARLELGEGAIEGWSALQRASDNRQSRVVASGMLNLLKRLKEISPSLAMRILCVSMVLPSRLTWATVSWSMKQNDGA